MAPKANEGVPCVFAVVPCAKFQQIYVFLNTCIEVPLALTEEHCCWDNS